MRVAWRTDVNTYMAREWAWLFSPLTRLILDRAAQLICSGITK
jgi:hypothetical protein